MIDILEWSREIINLIMTAKNDSKYLYSIKITLNPNPLNYDGCDEVLISIFERRNGMRLLGEKLYFTTTHCFSLDEAIAQVNKFVATQIK